MAQKAFVGRSAPHKTFCDKTINTVLPAIENKNKGKIALKLRKNIIIGK